VVVLLPRSTYTTITTAAAATPTSSYE
jgi:hypothetical protein